MSYWTYIKGSITTDQIRKEGIIKLFNIKLSKDKDYADYEYDCFVNNLKNFKIIKRQDATDWNPVFKKDYREIVTKFISELPKISGTEGRAEYSVGFFENHYKLWNVPFWSSSREYNKKKKRFVSDRYEEDYKQKDVIDVEETSIGDRFNLTYYGAMRDREQEDTCKEVIDVIREINKYFSLLDIDITISNGLGVTTNITLDYDRNYDKIIKVHTITIDEQYGNNYKAIKRTKKSNTKILQLTV